jgi:hypothetical protein
VDAFNILSLTLRIRPREKWKRILIL